MNVTPIDRVRAGTSRRQPTAFGVVGLLLVVAAFSITGGPAGVAAGIALFVAGLVVPAIWVFALGQAALLAVSSSPMRLQILAVEGALFLVVLAATARAASSDVVSVSLLLFGLLGTAVWLGVPQVGLHATAAGLGIGLALAGYLVHRYERVVLGLAGGETA